VAQTAITGGRAGERQQTCPDMMRPALSDRWRFADGNKVAVCRSHQTLLLDTGLKMRWPCASSGNAANTILGKLSNSWFVKKVIAKIEFSLKFFLKPDFCRYNLRLDRLLRIVVTKGYGSAGK
jgi:hypothetical protein